MTWGLDAASVVFDGQAALNGVSLELAPGQITAVVGGDGAGKTTLCRALVGLAPLSSGTVSRPDVVGFQPAESGTWRDLTVEENLRFVALAHRLDESEAGQRIGRLLQATNLTGAEDRPAGKLSGGMRQKLGVAMALLPEPELIVLDEPTTGVDPVSRLEIWAFLASAVGEGCAVLVTTAYVDEANRAEYVVALEDGRTLAEGTPQEVLASMPGALFSGERRLGRYSWRRGRTWRTWSPDGDVPEGAHATDPDLDDVVTVAALRSDIPS